jgi:hypothetical protein
MKCRKCGRRAVFNMRRHKLALCAEHYLEWFPTQVERAIHRYRMFTRDAKVLVAVSGGKDSLALWERAAERGLPRRGAVHRPGH